MASEYLSFKEGREKEIRAQQAQKARIDVLRERARELIDAAAKNGRPVVPLSLSEFSAERAVEVPGSMREALHATQGVRILVVGAAFLEEFGDTKRPVCGSFADLARHYGLNVQVRFDDSPVGASISACWGGPRRGRLYPVMTFLDVEGNPHIVEQRPTQWLFAVAGEAVPRTPRGSARSMAVRG